MKKIIAILMTAVLVFSLALPCFAYGDSVLKFDKNGEFKILHLTDIQDVYPMEEAEVKFIGEVLDYVKPDLVVLGGDNIVCDGYDIYDQLMPLFTSRNLNFTLVFGNHDDESSSLNKEQQLLKYMSYPGCLAYDAQPSLHGCGTHYLPILSSSGQSVAFALYMFDSGDYVVDENGNRDGYDCVHEDQIEWYKNTGKALQALNNGKVVPALSFQHIIPQEIYKAAFMPIPFPLGEATRNFKDGTNYTLLPYMTRINGIILEPPCPSTYNYGQWDAFAVRGDMLGCVTGHDHINSFICSYKGVDFIQSPGATYHSYGRDLVRGARVITLNEKDLSTYDTEIVTASQLALKDGSGIPQASGTSTASYYFINLFFKLISFFA